MNVGVLWQTASFCSFCMVSDVHFMLDCGALFPSAAAPLGRFLKRDKYSGSPRETRFTTSRTRQSRRRCETRSEFGVYLMSLDANRRV